MFTEKSFERSGQFCFGKMHAKPLFSSFVCKKKKLTQTGFSGSTWAEDCRHTAFGKQDIHGLEQGLLSVGRFQGGNADIPIVG